MRTGAIESLNQRVGKNTDENVVLCKANSTKVALESMFLGQGMPFEYA